MVALMGWGAAFIEEFQEKIVLELSLQVGSGWRTMKLEWEGTYRQRKQNEQRQGCIKCYVVCSGAISCLILLTDKMQGSR